MAITYGFYNAIKQSDGSYDRVYTSEQLGNMFEGLITDGVYESIDDAMIVKAKTDMTVEVGAGRAIVGSKWLKNDAKKDITLAASHATLNRYSAIVVQFNHSARTATIVEVTGTAAATPAKPVPRHTTAMDELVLAYVYVAKGATTISQVDISDVRADNTVCGWVTGVITQVDTSELFLQYQEAYEQQLNTMKAWQAQQEAQFDDWFSTLTSQLQVNTYVDKYHKVVNMGSSNGVFPLDMSGYTYSSTDILFVNVNGIMLTEEYDYLLDTSKSPVEIHTNADLEANNILEITVLKSKIGQS